MSDVSFDFSGRSGIVTGAGSGIGAAIALELGRSGGAVVVADLDMDAAEKVAAEIEAAGGKAAAVAGDVADPPHADEAVEAARKLPGRFSFAVNNAGIGGPAAELADYSLEGWARVIGINLDGVFYGMRAQIAAMVEDRGGAIVNMTSILGSVGFATSSAYVTAKHGVVGLTKNAALEYAGKGVRVNAVGPGFIETPLVTGSLPPETLEMLEGKHAMGRLGTPEEVAALTIFLLSERASFITGSYHLVDGGYTAQ